MKEDLVRCIDSIEQTTWLGFHHDKWLERSPVESLKAYARQCVSSNQMLASLENNLQDCGIGELAFLQSLTSIGI